MGFGFEQMVREKCRELNAYMTPQGQDRMSGRFHGQRVIGVTEARTDETGWVSDDEDAAFAVYSTTQKKYVHEYGIIECLREVKGKKVRKIDRVKLSDKKADNVQMLVRWYERPTGKHKGIKGKNKKDVWALPLRSSYVFKWVPYWQYLCRVDMEDDVGIVGHYSLADHSKKQANELSAEMTKQYC